MPRSRIAGTAAENRVADYLAAKGYTLVSRRVKTSRGEIDIIALDGETLVFVEVKMSSASLEQARRALTADKKSRLFLAAGEYVAGLDHQDFHQRLDVVLVSGEEIHHLEGAYSSLESSRGYTSDSNGEFSDEPEE